MAKPTGIQRGSISRRDDEHHPNLSVEYCPPYYIQNTPVAWQPQSAVIQTTPFSRLGCHSRPRALDWGRVRFLGYLFSRPAEQTDRIGVVVSATSRPLPRDDTC